MHQVCWLRLHIWYPMWCFGCIPDVFFSMASDNTNKIPWSSHSGPVDSFLCFVGRPSLLEGCKGKHTMLLISFLQFCTRLVCNPQRSGTRFSLLTCSQNLVVFSWFSTGFTADPVYKCLGPSFFQLLVAVCLECLLFFLLVMVVVLNIFLPTSDLFMIWILIVSLGLCAVVPGSQCTVAPCFPLFLACGYFDIVHPHDLQTQHTITVSTWSMYKYLPNHHILIVQHCVQPQKALVPPQTYTAFSRNHMP